ncbi:MAG: sulfite exporter TauE/SafE family protein [Pseudolabrys sp.]
MALNSAVRQRSGLRKNQNQDCRDPHCLSTRIQQGSAQLKGRWMDAASTLAAIAGAFLLAGFVKGVIGLGLPTVSIGLLGLLMTPAQAAAILVVPSLVTNIWQAAVGGGLLALARRLWPLLAGICIGTALGVVFLPRDDNGLATVWLGLALAVYAALGLVKVEFSVPRHAETWLGLLMGAATGAITVATGIFVMPGTPYIQSMEFDRDRLVQALGLSFTVSTITLAAALAYTGHVQTSLAWPSIVALVAALVGMGLGQLMRGKIRAETFRLCFVVGLMLLGLHLALRGLL